MEEFRELVLLLKNYSADERIALLDQQSIRRLPLRTTTVPHPVSEPSLSYHKRVKESGTPTSTGTGSKLEFRQKFWNTLLFMDLNHEDTADPNRVAYLCWQRLAVLKTLMAVGAIKSLKEIAESLLQMARAYELTTVVMETAAQLRQFCALHEGNMRAFEHYFQLTQQYEFFLEAEQTAEDEYMAFLFQQSQPQTSTQNLIEQAQQSCVKLNQYAALCHSNTFVLHHHFLKLQAAFLSTQWQEVVEISSQAEKLLSHKKVSNAHQISAFLLSKALGLANLGQLKSALETLSAAIQQEDSGSSNWYRLQEMKMTWLLHSQDYLAALQILRTLQRETKDQEWPLEQKRLYHTIFLYLIELGLLKTSNRIKGLLMASCLSLQPGIWFTSAHLNQDQQASLLFLQIAKIKQTEASEAANCLRQYMQHSGAFAPQSQRIEVLIQALEALAQGQERRLIMDWGLAALHLLPLDFSSPEAAVEILPLEFILQTLAL
jgi:hypothetical protein